MIRDYLEVFGILMLYAIPIALITIILDKMFNKE